MDPADAHAPPPRLLLPTNRADVRVTWHGGDRGAPLVSLWHGDVCAASAPLSTEQAARLAGFLVDHLAACAIAADRGAVARDPAGDDDLDPDAGPAAATRAATGPHQEATTPIEVPHRPHLRPAPEPGVAQRAGATVDEAITTGGEALAAAIDAARRTWRARRS